MKNKKGLAALGSVIRLSLREMDPLTKMHPEDMGMSELTAKAVSGVVNIGSIRLIGIDPSTKNDKCPEGKSYLAPLQAAGRKGRDALNESGLQFLGFEGARFVPYELQTKLYETFESAKVEHAVALQSLIDKYDRVKNEALESAAEALLTISGDNEASQVAYRRILAKYPTKEQVRAKFDIKWEAFHAVGVGQGGNELTEAEEMSKLFEQAQSMMSGLRKEVIDSLETVVAKATEGGKLRPASIAAAMRAFNRADALNVLGDPQIRAVIKKGRSLMDGLDRSENLTPEFKVGVAEVVQMMETDVKDAVKAVQDSLAGLGRRRISE
jgi:hypothetical protein